MTPPTTEPSRVTAGDTIAWTKSLPDYPASSGWILKYRLINAAGKIDITATAAGNDHAVSVPAATSAAWPAGTYTVTAWVEKGAERYTVSVSGTLLVEPNLAAAVAGLDTRSESKKILDALMVAYAAAAASHAYVQEYTVAGRRLVFQAKADWLLEINFWRREVANEEAASRRRAGLADSRKVYVRF